MEPKLTGVAQNQMPGDSPVGSAVRDHRPLSTPRTGIRRLVAWVVLSAVVVAGCEDSSPSTGADLASAGPLAADQYCEEIAEFFCAFYLRCGRMAVASTDECRSVFLETCNARYEPRYVALADAGLLALSSSGVAACRGHLSRIGCEQQTLDLMGPCAAMWRGTQGAGQACSIDVESFVCAPGTSCTVDLSLCGTCDAVTPTGEDCMGEGSCGPECYCDGAVCRPRPHAAEACDADRPCALPSRCVGSRCAAPTYVGEGDACDPDHRCPYLTVCLAGTCHRQALLGEACRGDRPCASGRCVGAICVDLLSDGEACRSSLDCRSGSCRSGACAPLPGPCL